MSSSTANGQLEVPGDHRIALREISEQQQQMYTIRDDDDDTKSHSERDLITEKFIHENSGFFQVYFIFIPFIYSVINYN